MAEAAPANRGFIVTYTGALGGTDVPNLTFATQPGGVTDGAATETTKGAAVVPASATTAS